MPKCSECDTKLPNARLPTSFQQLLWGGWTCPECSAELNRKGQLTAIDSSAPASSVSRGSTNSNARSSVVWSLLSLPFGIFIAPSIIAIVRGIRARREIAQSNGLQDSEGIYAILGIAVGSMTLFIYGMLMIVMYLE